jgi:broad-specificity NMP kinase
VLRRVFVVGATGVGKSTLAKKLAADLGCDVVSAGGWVRAEAGDLPVEDLTLFALDRLREDPDLTLRWVGPRPDAEYQVIEGVRNPRDLAILLDPKTDVVLVLSLAENHYATEWEEQGIHAILIYMRFVTRTWSTPSSKSRPITFVYRKDVDYNPPLDRVLEAIRSLR